MTLIHTRRYLLRPIAEDDAPVFAALCNDEAIARNTARIPRPYTLEDARSFTRHMAKAHANGKEFAFAVCKAGEIVACAGVMQDGDAWELGYWVAEAARGSGVATEAAGAVAHYAFDRLNAETVAAGYFIDNPASARVLQKLGFRETGEIVKTQSLGRGCDVDTQRMILRAGDFVGPDGVRIEDAF